MNFIPFQVAEKQSTTRVVGSSGFGDVGSPRHPEGSDDRVGQRGDDPRSIADTDPVRALSERFVSDGMELVFNIPVTSNDFVDTLRRGLVSVQAGDDINHLDGGHLVVAAFGGAGQASDLFRPGPGGSQHSSGRDDQNLTHVPARITTNARTIKLIMSVVCP